MDNAFICQDFLDWDHRAPWKRHRLVNRVLKKLGIAAMVVPPNTWGNTNVEARMNIFHLASQVAAYGVPGDFIEAGCNAGQSSLILQKILNDQAPQKQFHVYDSFEGLPDVVGSDAADGVYRKGAMSAGLQAFESNFRAVGLVERPHIHKGWFEETIPSKLPDRIAFAVVDGDTYSATKHVLPHIYERMAPGGICFLGIYYDETVLGREHGLGVHKSPGVKRATDEFFVGKPEKVYVLYANEYTNGYFRKR